MGCKQVVTRNDGVTTSLLAPLRLQRHSYTHLPLKSKPRKQQWSRQYGIRARHPSVYTVRGVPVRAAMEDLKKNEDYMMAG